MPELPDLQVFSRNLHKALHGKTIKEVTVQNASKLKVPADRLKKALEGQAVKKISRVGKELHIECSSGDVLGLHLMLNGELFLDKGSVDHKHTIIILSFTDDTVLTLTDYQAAATPTLNPEEKNITDALDVDANFLQAKLSKTKAAVKNVLLNQKVIRGIGNAYADEILWDAGIAPQSLSNKIPAEKIKALAKSILKVLQHAEKEIIKARPGIISGEVRGFLAVHNAKKTHSPTGAVIHHATTNSRKTYYTDEQELFS